MDKNIINFYKFISFSNFATALISIFIPVYLLGKNINLDIIILFILIQYLTCILIQNSSKFLFEKINIKYLIILSYIFIIWYYFLIYNFDTFDVNIFYIAILNGIGYGLFWLCYHILFSSFGNNNSRGKQTSITFILRSVTSFIAPLVGTFILYFLEFKYLFGLTILILLLNLFILFKFENISNLRIKFEFKEIYLQNYKDYFGFFGHGILIGSGVLWSIYIYVNILNSYFSLGLVTALSLFIATITRLIIGKLSDRYSSQTLKYGALSNLIVWFIKVFVSSSIGVFIIDFFDGITDSIKNIPFNSKAYNKAKETNPISYNIFRESIITFGIVGIISLYYFTTNFQLIFFIGSVSSLLYLFKI